MGVFVLVFGGLFWLIYWFKDAVDSAVHEREYDRMSEVLEKYYYSDFDGRQEVYNDLMCKSKGEIIEICESEGFEDELRMLFGNNWRNIVTDPDKNKNMSSTFNTPKGIVYSLILSKYGKLDRMCGKDLNHKCISPQKILLLYSFIEKRIQRFYPEEELFFWWYQGEDVFRSGKRPVFFKNFEDGYCVLNKLAHEPNKEWNPKRKRVSELINEVDIS